MMRRVVWSAVAAAVLAVASVGLSFVGRPEAVTVGLAAIVAAVLSNRDSR